MADVKNQIAQILSLPDTDNQVQTQRRMGRLAQLFQFLSQQDPDKQRIRDLLNNQDGRGDFQEPPAIQQQLQGQELIAAQQQQAARKLRNLKRQALKFKKRAAEAKDKKQGKGRNYSTSQLVKQLGLYQKSLNSTKLVSDQQNFPVRTITTKKTSAAQAAQRSALLAMQAPKTTSMTSKMITQQQNQASLIWRTNPMARWSTEGKQWVLYNNKGQTMNLRAPRQVDTRVVNSMLTKAAPISTAAVQQAPFLQLLEKKLISMGYAPMGGINKQGIALLLGRFKDPSTGRIKVIKKPSYLYNKYDFQQSLDHSMLNAAYKWNQYIRAQQQVINIMRKKANWDPWAKKAKEAQTDTAQMNRQIMMGIAKSIAQDKWPVYKAATQQEKKQLVQSLSNWQWKSFAGTTQVIAKRYLTANPNMGSDLQKNRWKRWSSMSTQGAVRAYKNLALGSLKPQQVLVNTKANRDALMANLATSQQMKDIGLLAAYRKPRTGPRGGKTAVVSISQLQRQLKEAKQTKKQYVELRHQKGLKPVINLLGDITQPESYQIG